jgi:heme/copper-type cytochrome/quinol oxidase subunit 2
MKVFARELIWLMIALMLCLPVAYIFGSMLQLSPEDQVMRVEEEVFEMELYIIGAIIGVIFTYIMRLVMWAIVKYAARNEE